MSVRVAQSADKFLLGLLRAWGRAVPPRGRWGVIYRTLKWVHDRDDVRVVTTRDGRRFCVRLNERLHHQLYFSDTYEPSETWLFEQMVQMGDSVFDIGANFGWYTTLFARLVGGAGEVRAFEPHPRNFVELSYQCALNRCADNVHLHPLALGDEEEGTVKIYMFDALSSGHASLSPQGRADADVSQCRMTTLDRFVQDEAVSRIDVIKVDVEGYELRMLRHAGQTLSRFQPMLVLECNTDAARELGYSSNEMLNLVRSYGPYEFFRARDGRVYRVDPDGPITNGWNVFCVARGDQKARIEKLLG